MNQQLMQDFCTGLGDLLSDSARLAEVIAERDALQKVVNRLQYAEAQIAALALRDKQLLKDAERWEAFRNAGGELTLRLHNSRPDMRDSVIDAAIAKEQK